MKIAQVAPLYESVPPKLYGGTERVVSYLTEELVRLGHEVTLFASGDSVTSAELVPCCAESLRLNPSCVDQLAHHFVMLEKVLQRADSFDLIHFHIDFLHYPVSVRQNYTHVTTVHGRLDLDDLVPLYDIYRDVPLVSISNAQRKPLPRANWVSTVYHGLPPNLLQFREQRGKYLAFLGRISPEKGVDRAIQIAERSGVPLIIAAKVDKADEEYFESLKPMLRNPIVDYIGEISDKEKSQFLANAFALIFPIDWPEPFGLVMIEAMACGTPIIAFRGGSVSEVMVHGKTGFVVNTLDQAVEAVDGINKISRAECRRVFDERYTVRRMASNYLQVYQKLLKEKESYAEVG